MPQYYDMSLEVSEKIISYQIYSDLACLVKVIIHEM